MSDAQPKTKAGYNLDPRRAPVRAQSCPVFPLGHRAFGPLGAVPVGSLSCLLSAPKAAGSWWQLSPPSNKTLEDFAYVHCLHFSSTDSPRISAKGRCILPISEFPFWALAAPLRTTASKNQGRNERQPCLCLTVWNAVFISTLSSSGEHCCHSGRVV